MSFNSRGEFDDVLEDVVLQGVTTIGTTETELKVGGSRESRREIVRVYNDSSSVIYIGPTGVTTAGASRGEPLRRRQWIELPIGDLPVYGIVASGTADAIIWEIG